MTDTGLWGLFFRRCSMDLIVINQTIVVLQDPLTFALQVFELALVQGPAEDRQDDQDKHRRQRDQQIENVHCQRPVSVLLAGR